MKKKILILTLFFSLFGQILAKDVDIDVLLRCISIVETGEDISAIGRKGERTQYQFLPSTWVMHSSLPFRNANNPKNQNEVDRVARKHLEFIKTTIQERNMRLSVYNIALMWNGGPNKVEYNLFNKDYAERVNNLYETMIYQNRLTFLISQS